MGNGIILLSDKNPLEQLSDMDVKQIAAPSYEFSSTVPVSIFNGRLMFCIPKEDFEFIISEVFGGKHPSMQELSDEVSRRTGIFEENLGKWNCVARLLHESVEKEVSQQIEVQCSISTIRKANDKGNQKEVEEQFDFDAFSFER